LKVNQPKEASSGLFGRKGLDLGILLAPDFLEGNNAVHEGVERVVLADAYVFAGIYLGTPLPDDDRAGADRLVRVFLNTQILRLRVSTVDALVWHVIPPLLAAA